ncbi:hypothetical protein [Arthrobacter sp. FW306-06-A]|uniref:hypothetical protein n=1 Tax=Arthrobacter sp. FW306-06-A TaxID=2879621 RepID=UPI001F3C5D53|nr:hypothetical protein [Arthrobacter sp. FW306-06-A]UKA69407.1 hypothetical protein LFT49_11495 [Arthrobacter sp. FW306-06-A]
MASREKAADGVTPQHAFLAAWVGWVSLGESIGFLAPALAQFLAATVWPGADFGLLVLAGLAESAVLGWSQAHVLRSRLPRMSTSRWILLTAAGAAFAWSVGMLPSAFETWQDWPPAAWIGAGGVAAILLLGSIGTAQWFELRRHTFRAWRWVVGSSAAWAAGLSVFMLVAPPLWQPGQPAWLIAAIGVAAAVLMAVVMALVTGLVLIRLLQVTPTAGAGR